MNGGDSGVTWHHAEEGALGKLLSMWEGCGRWGVLSCWRCDAPPRTHVTAAGKSLHLPALGFLIRTVGTVLPSEVYGVDRVSRVFKIIVMRRQCCCGGCCS